MEVKHVVGEPVLHRDRRAADAAEHGAALDGAVFPVV
jgi:hypothetical protein